MSVKERRNLVRDWRGFEGGGGRGNTYIKTPEQLLVKAFVRSSFVLIWFIL